MRKRVVLLDIAKELNVSKNTVSRALRDCDDISQEMKMKIKNKAKEMGYIPNSLSIFLSRLCLPPARIKDKIVIKLSSMCNCIISRL